MILLILFYVYDATYECHYLFLFMSFLLLYFCMHFLLSLRNNDIFLISLIHFGAIQIALRWIHTILSLNDRALNYESMYRIFLLSLVVSAHAWPSRKNTEIGDQRTTSRKNPSLMSHATGDIKVYCIVQRGMSLPSAMQNEHWVTPMQITKEWLMLCTILFWWWWCFRETPEFIGDSTIQATTRRQKFR